MPLALPADVQTAVARRHTDVVYLLELEIWQDQYGPSAQALTLRLADRSRQLLNAEWLPLVEEWPDLGDVLAPPATSGGYAVAGCDVTLRNHLPVGGQARFTDLIRSRNNEGADAYDGAFGNAKLLCVFGAASAVPGVGFGQLGFGTGSPFGGGAGSATGFFIPVRLKIDECTNVTEERCTLRMSGVEGALEDMDRLPRITTDRFPLADPDAIDKAVYLPIGRGLRGVPALGVVSGIVHKLSGDITPTSPGPAQELGVSDVGLLQRMIAAGFSAGVLQIDDEQIAYAAINLGTIAFGPGLTRGFGGTPAAAHKKGSAVYQVLSAYDYVVGWNPGAHAIAAIPRVYSDGVRVPTSSYTLTLDTAMFPGERVMRLRFTVLPDIRRQIVLSVQDTIAVQDAPVTDHVVQDTIGINTNGAEQASTRMPVAGFPITFPIPSTLQTVEGSAPALAIDLPMPQFAPGSGVVQSVIWEFAFEGFMGPFASADFSMVFMNQGLPLTLFRQIGPPTIGGATTILTNRAPVAIQPTAFYASSHVRFVFKHWLSAPGNPSGSGNSQIRLTSVKALVTRTLPITKTGAASQVAPATKVLATKTGTVAVTGNSSADAVLGQITVDMDGVADDGAGTITGVPGGPIERPAHWAKLLLREVFAEVSPALYGDWSGALAAQVAAGLTWAGLYQGEPFSAVRDLIARQSWCDLFQDGALWQLVWRDVPAGATPSLTADGRTLMDPSGRPGPGAIMGWTPRPELASRLVVLFDRDEGASTFRQSRELVSAFEARTGPRRGKTRTGQKQPPVEFPWITSPAVAATLATKHQTERERQRLKVRVFVPWSWLAIAKGDLFAVESACLTQHGGTAIAFQVRKKRYHWARLLLELEGLERGRFSAAAFEPTAFEPTAFQTS